ncbi:hypothetical protein DLAC_10163 [Tieghemostelium lacteum]|uniref:Uncharacterized protein n=1 Tax=Tieghemostelium lacteum TaxID=361077 RepID=A0A151Z6C9_TIELA|nr:hypothetical protein DLAC_10163 [Tieghemostelium lacteum]|eukprot:KYQ89488.1 hypothetical protein DLAC_10163 [Tieghemostelium lacteum]
METFNKIYLNEDHENLWVEELKKFNTEHENERLFIEKYGENHKVDFTKHLFNILEKEFNPNVTDKPSPQALTQVLISLRITLREVTETEVKMILNDIHLFFKFGNIGEDEKISIYSDEIRCESLKCIVNCIAKNKTIQAKFQNELNGPILLVKELKSNKATMSDTVKFPIYKILIHCCANPQLRGQLITQGLLDHTVQELVDRTAGNFEASAILSDLSRLLFTLTLGFGPLEGKPQEPKQEDYDRFRQLLPPIKKIFTYHCDKTHPMFGVKAAMVSALINTPKNLYDELVDAIPLQYFQSIFKAQLHLLDKPETANEFLTFLMLLTNIAENVPETRDELKKMTFPADLIKDSDEPLSVGIQPPEESANSGISSKLIPYMTSSDIGLKHFVGEYFFMVCDEDANEVCRLVGFGNAAGLLVTRGLMSLGGK